VEIQFPAYTFRVREQDGQRQIYDDLRRRYVAITPEEWVRQHLLRYLREQIGFPASRIGVEVPVALGGSTQRADVVVYDRAVQPWMVLECKAPGIALNRPVLDQAARYNSTLRAPYLGLCNGQQVLLVKVQWPAEGPVLAESLHAWPAWCT
jgi:hypothetical protein